MTESLSLDRGWRFRRLAPAEAPAAECTFVDLPHCPFVADLDGRDHWFGECEYQRVLSTPELTPGSRCVLHVGAAMHTASVAIDGREVGFHEGGYLPFEIDLTAALIAGASHLLSLRLDNRDNEDVPPGKPFHQLDFCWYGGLYRGAELRIYPAVHISDPIGAGEIAGGGIFVRTLEADDARARMSVRTQVCNHGALARGLHLRCELLHATNVVASATAPVPDLAANASTHVELELGFSRPHLWSPAVPALHQLRVLLLSGAEQVLDVRTERIGIRRISFSRSGGFVLNGRRMRLRGTNRHQEMPYVGYAAGREAEFRDARRIKEAGFDYVRLSHYPQSPDFLDACDEIGLVVMNCIPGWQHIARDRFRTACFENARQLIRRDRNHPCIVLWELSLNETPMDDGFVDELHRIGHEEYPGDQMFTCGWIDRYDVFIHSRQHGAIHHWRNGDKALVVAEYGDWEFFASNHGFDQKTRAGVFAAWSNSRKLRRDGERGMLQQLANHMIALNDTLASPAVLDGQWAMFDYARGYDPVRAACGIMDVFRLPKFSCYFYRSQRDPHETGANWMGGPVVFIASHWTPASALQVIVLSNCDEVELRLNGAWVARASPARTIATQHLPHPPFVFHLPRFAPGVLEATGFLNGKSITTHSVATPGSPTHLAVVFDELERPAAAGTADVLLAHIRLCDARGTLCVDAVAQVTVAVAGCELVGPSQVDAEAGIASVVIRLATGARALDLSATAVTDQRLLKVCAHWPGSQNGSFQTKTAHVAVAPVSH